MTSDKFMPIDYVTNCISPFLQPTPITYTFTTPKNEEWLMNIRLATNGFILKYQGNEYVFNTVDKMNAFIEKQMQGAK